MKKLILAAFLAALGTTGAKAVVITWNFGDDNATFDTGSPLNFSVSDLSIGNSLGTVSDPVNSTSASSGYAGSSGTGNIGNAQRIGALATGASGSGYIELTITAAAGYTFTLSDFDFAARSTSTGSQAFALRSSDDGYASDLFTGSIANNSAWSLKDNTVNYSSTVSGGAITFRLYGYNGTGSAGSGTENTRFDDFGLNISAVAVPEPSTYALIGLGLGGLVFLRRAIKSSKV